jgi:hypothetical protein
MHDRKRLVPDGFEAPATLESARFRMRMLSVHDVVKDYDAVMSSVDHLQSTFSRPNGFDWPEGLTLEDDLIDLGWHQREFTSGYFFAYTVMNPDESRCLGCVYINPTRRTGFDAAVVLWVRADELASGLDDELYGAVRDWIASAWPFENPAFPGREIPAEEWYRLPIDG